MLKIDTIQRSDISRFVSNANRSPAMYLYSACLPVGVEAAFPDRHSSFEAGGWVNAHIQTARWEYRPGIQEHGYGNRQCPWESELC